MKVLLLLSHLPGTVCSGDLPISMMKTAIVAMKKENHTLVVSSGSLHWDLVYFMAQQLNMPIELVISMESNSGIQQHPCSRVTLVHYVKTDEQRDLRVCELDERIYPLWIRAGGHFETILYSKEFDIDNSYDCSRFQFDCAKKVYTFHHERSYEKLLWHWTRTESVTPRDLDYWKRIETLLQSKEYPFSALGNLQHIIDERRIHSSVHSIAGSVPVCCFTENDPKEMREHFSWRRGKHRMNFEPYGIGIPREILASQGAMPLVYHGDPSWCSMQNGSHWESEREWRIRGDFILDDCVWESMVVVVYRSEEVPYIQAPRVISLV